MGTFLETYSHGEAFEAFREDAMGTENVLLLRGEGRGDLGRVAQDAFRILHRLERLFSKFLPDSDISQVNERAALGAVPVDEELMRLLELAAEAWRFSNGAFDPTIGPLMAAWGMVGMEGRVPDDDELRRLAGTTGMDALEMDARAGTVRFGRPGICLDLGGIAKGYAADQLVAYLQRAGVEFGAVICGRSTVVTWGTPPDEDGWQFEVVHPQEPAEALCTLRAQPGAVSSSGAYERQFRRGVHEYGHILDPRTARPAECLRGATVWSEGGVLGDVLSTILYVVGATAFEATSPVLELARRWAPAGGRGRFSALLVETDTSAWGGLRPRFCHTGEPALVGVDISG